MSSNNQCSLWLDSPHSRLFLIPNERNIPDGDFIICPLSGEEKKVDPAALTPFEITEPEARAYLQTEMNQDLEQAKNAVGNLKIFSEQIPQETPSNLTSSSNQTESAQNLIAILLGVTPEELQNNPKAARSAFVKISTKLQEILGESTFENSTQVETTRSHLRSLRETLRTQGFETSEDIEKLPALLQEILSSPKIEQYLQEMVAKLQTLADKSNQSPEAVGQTINEIIQTLNKELFGEEESRREQERRQEYRKLADDAIAQSFSKLEIPSFAGGFLKMEVSQQPEDEQK